MDVTSAVRSDALPAVGSILVPGAVAAAPYVALAWGPPHNLKAFVDGNQAISTAAGVLLIVGVGLLVESLGTFAEYYIFDRFHREWDTVRRQWKEYLQIAWVREPIGQNYLRRVLTSFKFELNLLVAATATLPGTLVLKRYGVLPHHASLWIVGLTVVAMVYLFVAIKEDSRLLARLRADLIEVARAQNVLPQAGQPAELNESREEGPAVVSPES